MVRAFFFTETKEGPTIAAAVEIFMTDIYMAFARLPAKQIFHTAGREWVKCPSMMRSGDIIFNAFVNVEEDILAGKAVQLHVRLFDSEDLVHFDSNQAFFIPDITSNSISTNDN